MKHPLRAERKERAVGQSELQVLGSRAPPGLQLRAGPAAPGKAPHLPTASPVSLTGLIFSLRFRSQEGARTTARAIKAQSSSEIVTATQQCVPGLVPRAGPQSPPPAPQPTHPVLAEAASLHTGPLEAEAAIPAAGAVGPGEVAGLAQRLALGLAGAPQLAAALHVGAGLGAHAEGQLALLAQGVAGTRQVLRQGHGLAGLVQKTVACRGPRALIRGEPEKWPWPAQGLDGSGDEARGTERAPSDAVGRAAQTGRGRARLPGAPLTVPAVQEVSDDGGAAGRPGVGAVDLDERRGHHLVAPELPEHLLAHLHVVVGHVEHVACRGRQEASEGGTRASVEQPEGRVGGGS